MNHQDNDGQQSIQDSFNGSNNNFGKGNIFGGSRNINGSFNNNKINIKNHTKHVHINSNKSEDDGNTAVGLLIGSAVIFAGISVGYLRYFEQIFNYLHWGALINLIPLLVGFIPFCKAESPEPRDMAFYVGAMFLAVAQMYGVMFTYDAMPINVVNVASATFNQYGFNGSTIASIWHWLGDHQQQTPVVQNLFAALVLALSFLMTFIYGFYQSLIAFNYAWPSSFWHRVARLTGYSGNKLFFGGITLTVLAYGFASGKFFQLILLVQP